MCAAKAASAIAAGADAASKNQGPFVELVVPVIVIEGRMFECFMNEAAQIEVKEVSEGTLVWRNPIARLPNTIIKVTTLPHLSSLVTQASEAADLLLNSDSEIRRALQAETTKEGKTE
jgi:hypothetical protein